MRVSQIFRASPYKKHTLTQMATKIVAFLVLKIWGSRLVVFEPSVPEAEPSHGLCGGLSGGETLSPSTQDDIYIYKYMIIFMLISSFLSLFDVRINIYRNSFEGVFLRYITLLFEILAENMLICPLFLSFNWWDLNKR